MLETNKDDKRHEIQRLDKIGSTLGYNVGFFVSAISVGLVAGLILGAINIIKYCKNKSIQNQTKEVSQRAQNKKISLKELDKLSVGQKIPNEECTRIGLFIDGLERKLDSPLNEQQVGDKYTFTKNIDLNGVINYTVKNVKSKQIAASFNLNRHGEITAQSRDKLRELASLDEFVIDHADKVDVNLEQNMSWYEDEADRVENIEREIKSVKNSIELAKPSDSSELLQSQYIRDLDEANHQLFALKAEAKTIADRIQSAEIANHQESHRHPENTLFGIKVSLLVDKLVGLNQQIDGLQSDLQVPSLPQNLDRPAPKISLSDRSFSEEEYPNLPADLNDLQASQYQDLDELLQSNASPANGQPITILEPENSDDEAEGLAQ